jgi:hypothetical protein
VIALGVADAEVAVGHQCSIQRRAPPHGPWSASAARAQLRHAAVRGSGAFAPTNSRHEHAVHRAFPMVVIHRQLGHSNLGVTSICLQGIDSTEIIDTVHARRAPMIPVDLPFRP